ncbi:MAG: glycosyltransferase family 2 protein [Candidatus Bathyarchaeota archaeon]|nr:glycosyltransferase family 2 protein [Candidatus Termitimicrobium sp.]
MNFNGKRFLDMCISSILDQDFTNFEILFVDNASTDGSVEYIKTKFGYDSRIKIIQNDYNSGAVEGNNIGIRNANPSASYIFLLNNDTELGPNWLSSMVKVMENNPQIGAAGSKQYFMNERKRLQGIGSFIDCCGFNHQIGENQIDFGQYDREIIPIFASGTTALFIRSVLLKKIGLLDPMYHFGFDDVDLCWRIWLSGHEVVCVSKCITYHRVSGTPRNLSRVLFHREKNRIMITIKNYGLYYQLRFLPFIFAFDLSQLLVYSLTNNYSSFQSIVQALIWDIKHFKHMWHQHLKIKYCVRKVSDKEISRHMFKINITELWSRIGT